MSDNTPLYEGEHIEYIGTGLELIVSKEHTFGTDALLLADFAAPKKNGTVCDLGTGCGIIPFYWLREGHTGKIFAVDIQEQAHEQLRRSVLRNAAENMIPVLADLRELRGVLPSGEFSLVSMNPPYTAPGSGIISSSESDKLARHGTACGFEDVCGAASFLLKFGGSLCVCFRPERLAEMICAMRASDIEPKRLRFVSKCPGRAPWLCLLEGKKGRRPGLTAEPELYTGDGDSGLSEEMLRIIGSYRKD